MRSRAQACVVKITHHDIGGRDITIHSPSVSQVQQGGGESSRSRATQESSPPQPPRLLGPFPQDRWCTSRFGSGPLITSNTHPVPARRKDPPNSHVLREPLTNRVVQRQPARRVVSGLRKIDEEMVLDMENKKKKRSWWNYAWILFVAACSERWYVLPSRRK